MIESKPDMPGHGPLSTLLGLCAGVLMVLLLTVPESSLARSEFVVPVDSPDECEVIHNVSILYYFEPGDVTINAGDCVRWINDHYIEHSAVGMDREFNTGILMPGGTALLRFDEPGGVPYTCGVHPLMVAVVAIEERA